MSISTEMKRRIEINQLVADEGIKLPMSVDNILWMEARGHVVDLVTGEVTLCGADKPISRELVKTLLQRSGGDNVEFF